MSPLTLPQSKSSTSLLFTSKVERTFVVNRCNLKLSPNGNFDPVWRRTLKVGFFPSGYSKDSLKKQDTCPPRNIPPPPLTKPPPSLSPQKVAFISILKKTSLRLIVADNMALAIPLPPKKFHSDPKLYRILISTLAINHKLQT